MLTHFLEASSCVRARMISPSFIISRKISRLLLSTIQAQRSQNSVVINSLTPVIIHTGCTRDTRTHSYLLHTYQNGRLWWRLWFSGWRWQCWSHGRHRWGPLPAHCHISKEREELHILTELRNIRSKNVWTNDDNTADKSTSYYFPLTHIFGPSELPMPV